jgi:general stress protein 26
LGHRRQGWSLHDDDALLRRHARPADGGSAGPPGGVIWFLTDHRGLKDDEIDVTPEVCLIFFYPKEKVYLSITGEAFVAHDPDRARSLWNERQKVWWSGPDDPNLRVVRVEPEEAEMWDGPANAAVAAFEFKRARLTGEKPDLGENRKVAVDMG